MPKAITSCAVSLVCLAVSVMPSGAMDVFSKANGASLAREFLLVCLNKGGNNDEVLIGANMLGLPAASKSLTVDFIPLPRGYVELATFVSRTESSPYLLRVAGQNDGSMKTAICEMSNPFLPDEQRSEAIDTLSSRAGLGSMAAIHTKNGTRIVGYDGTTWADPTAIFSSVTVLYPEAKDAAGISIVFSVTFNSN